MRLRMSLLMKTGSLMPTPCATWSRPSCMRNYVETWGAQISRRVRKLVRTEINRTLQVRALE